MQLTVTGKQVDVGDAPRRHVEAALDEVADATLGASTGDGGVPVVNAQVSAELPRLTVCCCGDGRIGWIDPAGGKTAEPG